MRCCVFIGQRGLSTVGKLSRHQSEARVWRPFAITMERFPEMSKIFDEKNGCFLTVNADEFFAEKSQLNMDNMRSRLRGHMARMNPGRTSVLDIIMSNVRRKPPQMPESSIIDLKREAEGDCSLKRLESMIESSQEHWRRSSLLRKDSMSLSRVWKKGRPFNIHVGTLLMTPSNMRSVAWLDLAEYTLDCGRYFLNRSYILLRIRRTSDLSRVVDVYHLETSCRDWSMVFSRFANDYMKRIEDSMRCEVMYCTAAALTRRWDIRRFLKYTNSLDYMYKVDREFHLTIFPRLLIQHCNDSEIIVRYFNLMNSDHPCASNKPSEYIVKHMSLPCLHFFMLHTMNALSVELQPEPILTWISLHFGLIRTAFKTGQNETLKLLLGFKWPYEFCFNLYERSPMGRLNWPRETEPLSASLCNSSLFTASLVIELINLSRQMTTTTPRIADGIRLFWRSLPTPYVSLDDLHSLVNIMEKGGQDIRIVVTMRDMVTWTREFISFYPTDCLATYQPRSLLHLTRCKIRQAIDRMVSVKFLPLPNNLKEYLWLKC